MRNEIRPGMIFNEEKMLHSLRTKGYYSSGIPRPMVIPKKARAIPSRPSSREMRYLTGEDLQRYIEDHKG